MPAPDLLTAELRLTGRITTASNATFLGSIGDVPVVYKPIAGESPLWDFPQGRLAHREVAAYLISQAFGWDVVPHTWLRDGPLGEGMVQLWQEQDPAQYAVNLVAAENVPEKGWKQVLQGQDQNGGMVALIHEDSPELRRMAVFDIVVNNADRKGDHILAMADGHRHGVDHGLTFHRDHKLRTVLWGWQGEALTTEEAEGIDRVSEGLHGSLGQDLADLLSAEEIAVLAARCARLRLAGRFPAPSGEMPAVPWPLF
ncbi:SCO1664 family protein [Paeniglutamicibacter psychrophenolicus]|uniref:Repeat protein (TIGR03843 family) n=1 Tax=Paeniglutamicibacter psychrophenolicus TaxID=257454 RepID=A0ABS4WD45_9MICC|nr:SCO1664 family protein [Paeniglutamicibacter psychrophenolicus]MBP2374135.1 putative repeat protein (TIGR03843 family) [Paeniglutamicibacter psychrophenolicus]